MGSAKQGNERLLGRLREVLGALDAEEKCLTLDRCAELLFDYGELQGPFYPSSLPDVIIMALRDALEMKEELRKAKESANGTESR